MTLLERYERRIEPEPNSGCWLWIGVRDQFGYGVMNKRGPTRTSKRKLYVHRFSFEHFKGPIPAGHSVLHHCDNPPCSNPGHLFSGSQRENVLDAARKRRTPIGERNGQAKLSEAEVGQIRVHEGSNIEVAREFGVSNSLIRAIRRGERWGRVCLK